MVKFLISHPFYICYYLIQLAIIIAIFIRPSYIFDTPLVICIGGFIAIIGGLIVCTDSLIIQYKKQ